MNYFKLFLALTGVGAVLIVIAKFTLVKFVGKLAEKSAELITLPTETRIVEKIKVGFDKEREQMKIELQTTLVKEIEPFKALLLRDNIEYQIHNTEFVQLRFLRLDALHGHLYELKKYLGQYILVLPQNGDEYFKIRDGFNLRYEKVLDAINGTLLYLNESVVAESYSLLDNFHRAFFAYTVSFNAEKNFEHVSGSSVNAQTKAVAGTNRIQAMENLQKAWEALPSLMNKVVIEFKKHTVLEK